MVCKTVQKTFNTYVFSGVGHWRSNSTFSQQRERNSRVGNLFRSVDVTGSSHDVIAHGSPYLQADRRVVAEEGGEGEDDTFWEDDVIHEEDALRCFDARCRRLQVVSDFTNV